MKSALLYALTLIVALAASLALTVFGASHANAAEVLSYSDADVGIMLHDSACKNADLAAVLQESVPSASVDSIKHAAIDYKLWQNMAVAGCWVFDGGEKIIIADEMGNAGFIKREAFKAVHAF